MQTIATNQPKDYSDSSWTTRQGGGQSGKGLAGTGTLKDSRSKMWVEKRKRKENMPESTTTDMRNGPRKAREKKERMSERSCITTSSKR